MAAYYNEYDEHKAAWLRELIAAGLICDGDVDERSIHDVSPDDLRGYTQCHFFAGIGVWSYSLRLAGWPDDRECWTGSCPCPSFSAAGKGEGFDDARHLWPVWMPLIRERRPPVVFGEQADGAIGHGWLDLVSTDLEASSYAVGAAVLGACSVGAPHRRQRLYFVAHAARTGRRLQPECEGIEQRRPHAGSEDATGELAHAEDSIRWTGERQAQEGIGTDRERRLGSWGGGNSDILAHAGFRRGRRREVEAPGERRDELCDGGHVGILGNSGNERLEGRIVGNGHAGANGAGCSSEGASDIGILAHSGRSELEARVGRVGDERGEDGPARAAIESHGADGGMADAESGGLREFRHEALAGSRGHLNGSVVAGIRPGPLNGYWRDADWIFCRDKRWRPVRPGSFPLAYGSAARVVRLRGYGDAINAEAAKAFIEAVMECV